MHAHDEVMLLCMNHDLGVEAAKVEVGFKRLTVEAEVRVGPAPC